MIINYTGVSGSRTAYKISETLRKENKILAVVSTGRAAADLARDLAFCVPNAEIIVLNESESLQILYETRDRAEMTERIKALQVLQSPAKSLGVPTAVIAPVSAALKLTTEPSRFSKSVLEISVTDRREPSKLRDRLVSIGYKPSPITESLGEFTAKAGILDVFPMSSENPVRIEFFDDEIESIREYDSETQRSIRSLDSVKISPAAEFIPTGEEKERALAAIIKEYDRRIKKIKKELPHPEAEDGRIERLEEYKGRIRDIFDENMNLQIYADYLEYFDVPRLRLWDYAAETATVIADPADVIKAIGEPHEAEDFYEIYAAASSARFSAASEIAYSAGNEGANKEASADTYRGSGGSKAFATSKAGLTLYVYTPFPERIEGAEKIDEIVNIKSRQIAPFNGKLELFASEVGRLASRGYDVIIASGSEEKNERVREYLEIADVPNAAARISYRAGKLSSGFIMEDEKICYIAESDIFASSSKKPKKSAKRKKSADSIKFSDLKKGDYVVHEAHGIGRFEGIHPLTADGQTRDYLLIRYAGSDTLYIPTEQLDVIQKYIGNSGNAPALSKLSGGSWARARERARRAVEEIAEDLVRLYAERQAAGGYAFGEDSIWQTEFEEAFPYEETDDQLRAAEEIKEDMQKALPMDRLLCGDVGYGKTEVAARAVFKCISEGKQAAILAPTTLLVDQHYHNLRERFSAFPFEIEELSRFRSETEQKKIVREIKNGSVDLVIGTHRLLSDDVKFKDLGLLVIDEEQRFGVRHKEKIKQLRSNIDVLTLSATPIPRTLNMSLTGIKDISIIDEPPGDRLPVSTFVSPYDEALLTNALERELARGGQVFVVSNRVMGINQVAESIQSLAPRAKVAVGHGRMSEEALEQTMLDFIEGRTDILVATTIIENGIDIPNANTMIILNADRFGLAQLYQLRGRVGRSHRLAYAYLMYQPGKVLTDLARKRLAAIREFTEFGAGFRLAMRDLELRGAGNILGEAQSGHIESIGYELYCKEIDRAVRKLKGEAVAEARSDISIELPVRASIPASYIAEESLRLQAYKKIAGIMDKADAKDVMDELADRYGELPSEARDLIKIAEIRAHAEKIGAANISAKDRIISIRFTDMSKLHPYAVVMTSAEFGDDLRLTSGKRSFIELKTRNASDPGRLLELMRALIRTPETAE